MLNFTVGPVQSSDVVRAIGAEQVPYFRTAEFSEMMLENERLVKKFSKATNDSRAVFMTCSGSGGMEAAIINCLSKDDKALVVNGGSFGQRFVELLSLHEIPFSEIKLKHGKSLKPEHLSKYEGKGYTAFLIQKHETSTGLHYDMDLVSKFCKRNDCFLIVDTISSFLCDPFDMQSLDAGVMITGSQKALACAPGIAVWTPAVGILRQINARLREIEENGGVETEIERCASLANYFRDKLVEHDLPFEVISESLSNALTPLRPTTQSANEIFLKLKDEYGIWVCPNGGDLKDTVFRVGHIGYLHKGDYDRLISAFLDLRKKKFI